MGMIETGGLTDSRTHAKDSINRTQVQPQGVTADVTCINTFAGGLFNGEKAGPVRTSGTQGRAPPGEEGDFMAF